MWLIIAALLVLAGIGTFIIYKSLSGSAAPTKKKRPTVDAYVEPTPALINATFSCESDRAAISTVRNMPTIINN
jgi:hypothetical protein